MQFPCLPPAICRSAVHGTVGFCALLDSVQSPVPKITLSEEPGVTVGVAGALKPIISTQSLLSPWSFCMVMSLVWDIRFFVFVFFRQLWQIFTSWHRWIFIFNWNKNPTKWYRILWYFLSLFCCVLSHLKNKNTHQETWIEFCPVNELRPIIQNEQNRMCSWNRKF